MNYHELKTAALVDAYGYLKAEAADLAKREKAVKAALERRMEVSGATAVEGDLYRVTRSPFVRESIDAARVREILNDVPTKVSTGHRWTVSARVIEVAA